MEILCQFFTLQLFSSAACGYHVGKGVKDLGNKKMSKCHCRLTGYETGYQLAHIFYKRTIVPGKGAVYDLSLP